MEEASKKVRLPSQTFYRFRAVHVFFQGRGIFSGLYDYEHAQNSYQLIVNSSTCTLLLSIYFVEVDALIAVLNKFFFKATEMKMIETTFNSII